MHLRKHIRPVYIPPQAYTGKAGRGLTSRHAYQTIYTNGMLSNPPYMYLRGRALTVDEFARARAYMHKPRMIDEANI